MQVADVAAVVDAFAEAGGSVVRTPEAGPHETRAVVRNPWGNLLVIYGRL